MRRRNLATLLAVLLLMSFSTAALAADNDAEDTDTRMINARVVEVNDHHISVIARTGVEHVIALDGAGTKVRLKGKLISPKNLREGDVVTIELDELKQVKFAKQIVVAAPAGSELAATGQ